MDGIRHWSVSGSGRMAKVGGVAGLVDSTHKHCFEFSLSSKNKFVRHIDTYSSSQTWGEGLILGFKPGFLLAFFYSITK